MINVTTPWVLALLILLPATALVGYTRLRRLPGRRGLIALSLRLLVLANLVMALAGPQWRTQEGRVSVVFLIDASASVGAAGQRAGMAWAERASSFAGPGDEAGAILFGATPHLAVPLAHYKSLRDPAARADSATDIGAALRLGLSMIPPGRIGRLVLLSDGRATAGDMDAAMGLALARGIPVDTVPVTPRDGRDVLVRAVEIPPLTRVGDDMPVRIVLHSAAATTAQLTVFIDGVVTGQSVSLAGGDTVYHTEQRIETTGVHTVRVRVDAPGDTMAQNNALDAATVTGPPGRILFVVNPSPDAGGLSSATGLATTLARAKLGVLPITPASLPTRASAYHGYDAVVLDDVPATALSHAQQRALRDAVYGDGLGLLTSGGPDAYGQGGYPHSVLEDALPVLSVSTPRRITAPLALMLIIDKSGSMADVVDGVPKVDMVKVAAASGLDRLNNGDAVGVLAFDDTNHWIVPFHVLQGPGDKTHMRRQIAELSADGDTYIYPALQAAERAVLSVPTTHRHIVLLTDGQGEDAPFDMLVRRMRREHITLSTIGVGSDVVQDELSRWASLGGGHFHYVSDPHDIPRIIINETRFGASGGAEVRGHIHLSVAGASPLLRALSGKQLPALTAYDTAVPKAAAQISVQTTTGDPLLSSWQYGLGRVVSWTSDAGASGTAEGPWAGGWSVARLPSFWVDLARWSLRGYVPGARVPRLEMRDGALQISTVLYGAHGGFDDTASPRVQVVTPDGAAQVIALPLTAPGTYSARVPVAGPGVYRATFARDDRAARPPAGVAALAVPYPAEYAGTGVDMAFLAHLSTTTSGRVLARPADAFAHDGLPLTAGWMPLWPLLLALALLLFPLDVAVRLLLPPDPVYRR